MIAIDKAVKTLNKILASLILFGLTVSPAGAVSLFSETGTRESSGIAASAEKHLPTDAPFTPWLLDPSVFDQEQGDRLEVQTVSVPDVRTVKLTDLIPPVRFRLGEAEIPEEHLEVLRDVLERMRDRENVRLHFVGHADSLPLSDALQKIYGDNVGLSRERAGTTAEYCQRSLGLPPEAISYEGLGDSRPVASNATEAGRSLNRRVEVEVWYDEIGEKEIEKEVVVEREVQRVQVCRTETVCKLRYKDGHSHRARIKNLMAPLLYDQGMVSVPETFLNQVAQALHDLRGKEDLVVRFVAHTDNEPLAGRSRRIYGNHLGLSKAVARRVALAVKDGLDLPDGAIESVGLGASRPAASNDSPRGRMLNRRVEVEFWHDDPLQELPDEPQVCPDPEGAEMVTKVYHSPSGPIAPLLFSGGEPVVPAGYTARLRRLMNEIAERNNVRLRFIGHTRNERLDRRTAAVYGDAIGLSTVRARRAMSAVAAEMGLDETRMEFEGRGYVQSDDVVNTGFIESDTSRVRVQVVYDEFALLDDYEGVEITPLEREVDPENPFALNLMRISVDGEPVDDPGKSVQNVQRCIDLALDEVQIRFHHDSLKREPRLNVTAWPATIALRDRVETPPAENRVRFRLYANYRSFIDRAEVRIFESGASPRSTPLAVVAMDAEGMGEWRPEFENYSAPRRELQYLVRVYDAEGRFDETAPQPLWVVDELDSDLDAFDPGRELLTGYGESRLARRTIPLQGGTVLAHGSAIPSGHRVWLAGHPVPLDASGRFIAEEILPSGMHTVEVAVLDAAGNGELFLRDLALERSDWFTVGIADLTFSANETEGPARLLAPDRPAYENDLDLQGRLAFYSNGTFGDGWEMTASADTREGPLDEIFSNFLDKSPEALLRRIEPEDHYPTYGDDSTVVEDAPTSGKFYLKMERQQNHALWGNFTVDYTGNSLAEVDRGLYGANLHYQSDETTAFGEERLKLDGFAADPGTVAGRDEFRGTGGSLYFLSRQDVLRGSERLRVEIRDKDSGRVLGVKSLVPGLDYDLDYLQGRILLAEPLSPTADDDLLVESGSISGHPAYLVVRYEFTPGFDEPEAIAAGGRIHYWLNDHLRVGLTGSRDESTGPETSLGGADLVLRKSTETWLRLEAALSEGPGVDEPLSLDGGFHFDDPGAPAPDGDARAWRAEGSLGLGDLIGSTRGQATFYLEDLEAGYAAPGLLTDRDTTRYGGSLEIPVGESLRLKIKSDRQEQDAGLTTAADEVNVDYRLGDHWSLGTGVRHDRREDDSAEVPSTREEGERTDLALRLLYDSLSRWSLYGFAQESLQTGGNRQENGRLGLGGSYRLTDRLKVDGEVSDGDLGAAARLGTEYLYSDRTTLYLNYALENERSDNGLRARKGSIASGFRTRYADSATVFLEERYTHGDVPTGLMHTAGVDLAPTDRLNLGATVDYGTLEDHRTGAELERTAASLSAGYGFDRLKVAGAIEYRVDEREQPDAATDRRTTWLLRNSFKYRLSPDWRLLGSFDRAWSDSSAGESDESSYTEAVLGYAYRPVDNDRLNALLKYTYFSNLPPAGQTVDGTSADVAQRSHIGAVDVMYDLTPRWTVGGKYAYRQGEVSLDRENSNFVSSRAHLVVLRADWHFLHRWDALVEGRALDLPDAGDRLDGVFFGLYRHVGNHFKVGAGYNFSSFSDDLTDMDYDHRGLFINFIGKM